MLVVIQSFGEKRKEKNYQRVINVISLVVYVHEWMKQLCKQHTFSSKLDFFLYHVLVQFLLVFFIKHMTSNSEVPKLN